VWVLCLYFMGLNLSNRQIAMELQRFPLKLHRILRLRSSWRIRWV
jgi:hypothetical protein